jgi:solute carrier family 25 oxoglutarate transporter 11
MVLKDGIKSIYAGLSASLTRQCTYGTARMGIHRSISDFLQKRNGGNNISFGEKAAAGLIGGALAVCIGTPFDVTLVRMQADTMKPEAERLNYKGVSDALRRVVQEEGFGALYKGLAPNIGRGMAMNVGMMACSDQAKEMMIAITKDDHKNPGMVTRMGAAGAGGFFAAFLSLPFDLLKSRMQNMRVSDGKPPMGLAECAIQVLRKEGPLAFWTGFGAYYTRCAPHAMIILLTLDEFKRGYDAVFGA